MERAQMCTSYLPELPTELVWHVTSYLTVPQINRSFDSVTLRRRRYDLCALRSTCCSQRGKVHGVFLYTTFTELDVDLTLQHLEAFVRIPHNAEYAAAIRSLHFVADQSWPETLSDDYFRESRDKEYVERGAGAALLTKAMDGLINFKTVKMQPVPWVHQSPMSRQDLAHARTSVILV
jgi:hypothetical protein